MACFSRLKTVVSLTHFTGNAKYAVTQLARPERTFSNEPINEAFPAFTNIGEGDIIPSPCRR